MAKAKRSLVQLLPKGSVLLIPVNDILDNFVILQHIINVFFTEIDFFWQIWIFCEILLLGVISHFISKLISTSPSMFNVDSVILENLLLGSLLPTISGSVFLADVVACLFRIPVGPSSITTYRVFYSRQN